MQMAGRKIELVPVRAAAPLSEVLSRVEASWRAGGQRVMRHQQGQWSVLSRVTPGGTLEALQLRTTGPGTAEGFEVRWLASVPDAPSGEAAIDALMPADAQALGDAPAMAVDVGGAAVRIAWLASDAGGAARAVMQRASVAGAQLERVVLEPTTDLPHALFFRSADSVIVATLHAHLGGTAIVLQRAQTQP